MFKRCSAVSDMEDGVPCRKGKKKLAYTKPAFVTLLTHFIDIIFAEHSRIL